MALERLAQLAVKQEALEGVGETLTENEAIPVLPGASFSPDFGRIERSIARDTLDPIPGIPGLRSGTLNFQMALQGNSAGIGSVPPWDLPARMCGFKRIATRICTYSSFATGSVISDMATFSQTGSSPASGVVHGRVREADARVFLQVTNGGTVESGTLITFTNPDASTVTITPSAVGQARTYRPTSLKRSGIVCTTNTDIVVGNVVQQAHTGLPNSYGVVTALPSSYPGTVEFEWYLGSQPFNDDADITEVGDAADLLEVQSSASQTQVEVVSGTLGFNMDGHLLRLRGSRGNLSATFNNGELPVLNFAMTGVLMQPSDALQYAFPGDGLTPPTVTGGSYLMGDDLDFAPEFDAAGFDMGSEVALRRNANDSSGYSGSLIGNRSPSGTMDPVQVKELVYPQYGDAWDQTVRRSRWLIGAESGNGNSFLFNMSQTQVSGASPAARDNLRTVDHQLAFVGSADGSDDSIIFHAY